MNQYTIALVCLIIAYCIPNPVLGCSCKNGITPAVQAVNIEDEDLKFVVGKVVKVRKQKRRLRYIVTFKIKEALLRGHTTTTKVKVKTSCRFSNRCFYFYFEGIQQLQK